MENQTIKHPLAPQYVGRDVTFRDGSKGIVSGRCERFAMVRSFDGKISIEYAWETLARLIDAGVRFPIN